MCDPAFQPISGNGVSQHAWQTLDGVVKHALSCALAEATVA